MINTGIKYLHFTLLVACLTPQAAIAAEYNAHGILDFRVKHINSSDQGYLTGGQGKLGLGDGVHFSAAQIGADLSVSWDNGLSAHGVFNAYPEATGDGEKSALGLTEIYLKYRSLPNSAGYRIQTKAGLFYPEISLENNAYAWASKDTLDSSTLNTWIGEEIRVVGTEIKVTRLGRINNDKYDLSFSATAFVNNDPAGALLAWHGWAISNRQTLWNEQRTFPWFPAREEGKNLAGQAHKSDPFLELDSRVGYHTRGEWKLRGKGSISAGYYDNRAIPYKVVDGQYGWRTRFYHLGTRWRLSDNLSLTAQYLSGDTLMQSKAKEDVVNNDYASGFVALHYNWHALVANKKHKSTLRVEDFSVTDNDKTEGDDNNEDGQALTLNHSYRLNKQWFLSAEFTVIDSHRPARAYTGQPVDSVETQWQFATRYFL
ncbi:hypothetical protein [Psychromonas sp. SR45-3]|uniref:hypothetical protein n=1 Tax=Psychromonas sp. SR45-3 TaxID=2760930 RepID=UPI00287305CE|nr:hypothetical protein [Psychromonas sp. SR45-3]